MVTMKQELEMMLQELDDAAGTGETGAGTGDEDGAGTDDNDVSGTDDDNVSGTDEDYNDDVSGTDDVSFIHIFSCRLSHFYSLLSVRVVRSHFIIIDLVQDSGQYSIRQYSSGRRRAQSFATEHLVNVFIYPECFAP